MNVLSLFDGMSGARIALERANIPVERYFSSEIDTYAIQIANKNYPQDASFRLGDIVKLKKKDLKKLKIDLLIGGSPCQGFSMAGKLKGSSTKCGQDVVTLKQYKKLKKEGFEFDGQSYLFWEFIRVMEIIKPKYFLLENVRVTKKWLPMFNNAVGVEAMSINSSLVSAQNRPRFYWTNIPNVTLPVDKGEMLVDIIDPLGIPIDPRIRPQVRDNIARDIDIIRKSTRMLQVMDCTSGFQDNKVGILKSPTVRASNHLTLGRDRDGNVKKLVAKEWEILQTVPVGYTEGVSNSQRHRMIGNGFTIDIIAHILGFIDV